MTTMSRQIYLPLQFSQILEIVKQLGATEQRNLLLFLLGHQPKESDLTLTHLASEDVLAKDWLTETEDEAWQHL